MLLQRLLLAGLCLRCGAAVADTTVLLLMRALLLLLLLVCAISSCCCCCCCSCRLLAEQCLSSIGSKRQAAAVLYDGPAAHPQVKVAVSGIVDAHLATAAAATTAAAMAGMSGSSDSDGQSNGVMAATPKLMASCAGHKLKRTGLPVTRRS
jgi:hypothetical protein